MKTFIYSLLLVILISCSSSKNISYDQISEKNNANIIMKSLYLWVDKMPSSNKNNNLKLSADLIVETSKEYDINLLKLSRIQIFQDSLLVYNFKPVVKDNPAFNKKGKRNLIVATIEQTDLPEEFNIKKDMTVRFIFEFKQKVFVNTFNKVKVDVTY